MSLRINDMAPDFVAETTQGTIKFHEWIGDGWAILFPIPKTSLPCAPLSSAIWRVCNRNLPNATARSSG